MDTKVILKAESILEEMMKSFKSERSGLYSDAHLSKLANNYNLSFKTHKFKIVTTIKLDLEFRLIGVFTWIPEGSGVNDVALAKASMNEKLLSLYEVKIAPVLSKVVGA
ncbi:hypothetical protein NG726_27535 [Pseudomonas sp. MOB-449]|nr:hypothetical protein [Pseudomonas sp. MOB-449]